jgi:hypothetical protein
MRVPAALVMLSLSMPALAAGTPPVAGSPGASAPDNCPRTTSYLAEKSSLYRGQPLTPRKLTELPPGTAYMTVYRHIGACEVPLTMVDYRNPRRR